MSRQFTILVGTMTGTADLVADEISAVLDDAGLSHERLDMGDVEPSALQAGRSYIICTSTYGSGDVPDNARPLFEALERDRPDLSGVGYAVFGLGDSTYPQTFGFGGKRFDQLLAELGAHRIAETRIHNASGGTLPEDDCVSWAQALIEERPMDAAA